MSRRARVASKKLATRAPQWKLRAILDNDADGFSILAADGIPEYVSPAVSRILGHKAEDLRGVSTGPLIHPDDLGELRRIFRELASRPGSSRVMVGRVLAADGSTRWLESTTTNLLHDPDVGAIVVRYRDVTDRVTATDALKTAHERLAYLLSATSAVIYALGVEPPCKATFVSENVRTTMRHPAASFMADPRFWVDRVHPDDRERILSDVRGVFETGRHVFEYRWLHGDGTYRWMHTTSSWCATRRAPPSWSAAGSTSRPARRLRTRCDAPSTTFAPVLETSPSTVLVSRANHIVYLNRAMLDLLRHGDAEQLLGHSPREIVATAGEGAIEAAERLERAAGVRVLQLDEQRLRRADGTTVEVELFATRADFDGSPAVVFTARDLTEKKALIARLAVSDRLASLGTLAAGVAHEIRPSPNREVLRDAMDGVERIRSVVRDLQSQARPRDTTAGPSNVRECGRCFDPACVWRPPRSVTVHGWTSASRRSRP